MLARAAGVKMSMSGCHQNASRANSGGELDVGPFVANYERARRIEIQIAARGTDHAGQRLAAGAVLAGRVRASIPTGDSNAFAREKLLDARLDGVGLVDRKIAAPDP